jgi:HEAT repeat protein
MDDLVVALADSDAGVRAAARLKLVAAGDAAVAPLLAALEDASSADARREAAQALGDLKAKAAVPALLAAVAQEPYEIASWAARALGRIGDRRAAPALVRMLPDESMRNAAALALADLGDAAAIAPLATALADLCDRFDYGGYLGRYWLAAALVRLGDKSQATRAALEDVIGRDFGPETQQTWGSLRDAAVDLLVTALGPEADPFLRPFLKRERETLQLRYRIARHYWLHGEQTVEHRAILDRMARHPLYPSFAGEARDLLATEN